MGMKKKHLESTKEGGKKTYEHDAAEQIALKELNVWTGYWSVVEVCLAMIWSVDSAIIHKKCYVMCLVLRGFKQF